MPIISDGGGGTIELPLTLTGTDPTKAVLTVEGAPGQATDVFQVRASHAGTIVLGATPVPEFYGPFAEIVVNDGLTIEAVPGDDTLPALAVYPQVARTKDALQVQNNLGAILARILAGGAVVTAQHAAPADADLAAGECAVWFDQTNGAGNTKLMCKGKSADGTVKTATLATLA